MPMTNMAVIAETETYFDGDQWISFFVSRHISMMPR